jgi:hypothetical protein
MKGNVSQTVLTCQAPQITIWKIIFINKTCVQSLNQPKVINSCDYCVVNLFVSTHYRRRLLCQVLSIGHLVKTSPTTKNTWQRKTLGKIKIKNLKKNIKIFQSGEAPTTAKHSSCYFSSVFSYFADGVIRTRDLWTLGKEKH